MTSQQLTALAIKILAIWLLVNMALDFPSVAIFLARSANFTDGTMPAVLSLAIFIGCIAVGLMVSFVMLRISKSVLSSTSESHEQNILTSTIALQITGLFFIVSSLASLPGQVLLLSEQATIHIYTYGYLAGNAFKLFVGAYLFVQPAVWLSWFNKARGSV